MMELLCCCDDEPAGQFVIAADRYYRSNSIETSGSWGPLPPLNTGWTPTFNKLATPGGIIVHGGALYLLSHYQGNITDNLWKYENGIWTGLGGPTDETFTAINMAVIDDTFWLVGGSAQEVNGNPLFKPASASWNGSTWDNQLIPYELGSGGQAAFAVIANGSGAYCGGNLCGSRFQRDEPCYGAASGFWSPARSVNNSPFNAFVSIIFGFTNVAGTIYAWGTNGGGGASIPGALATPEWTLLDFGSPPHTIIAATTFNGELLFYSLHRRTLYTFNGSQFNEITSELGPSTAAMVHDILVTEGEIIVVGENFTTVEGSPKNVAIWRGGQWVDGKQFGDGSEPVNRIARLPISIQV